MNRRIDQGPQRGTRRGENPIGRKAGTFRPPRAQALTTDLPLEPLARFGADELATSGPYEFIVGMAFRAT